MKSFLYLLAGLLFFPFCQKNDSPKVNYRNEMRAFVEGISQYGESLHPGFLVVPQNGQELLTENGEPDGPVDTDYRNAIDGQGREDVFYGYNADNEATPPTERDYLIAYLDKARQNGVTILSTDYCSTQGKIADSYAQNAAKGYVSFAADHRELDNIPTFPNSIAGENASDVDQLLEAKNFLYFINPSNFSKSQFIEMVRATNYDVLITDLFVNGVAFTADEVDSLKQKQNGGTRLVICYMSIGEAEDYRYYWQSAWKKGSPSWLREVNPDWAGNFKVHYWEKAWQDIIFGNEQSYTYKIVAAHFDGVYLDIIDGFEYFE